MKRTRKETTAKTFGSGKTDGPMIRTLQTPHKLTANVAAGKAITPVYTQNLPEAHALAILSTFGDKNKGSKLDKGWFKAI